MAEQTKAVATLEAEAAAAKILKEAEAKAEGYNKHASLDEFCKKFSARVGCRYLVYTKDLRKDEQTTLVPVYMTGLL